MARVVFHIGTHKTGTTTVQDTLHANRAFLGGHGVIYPDPGHHTGHHGYLTDWIALPPAYRGPGGGRAGLIALAEEWRDSDATLLLSSEEFSRGGGRGGQVDFDDLRRIFVGYDPLVICLLRDQRSFLQSVYLELSRHGLPPRPPEFLSGALATGMIDGLWCDYGALIAGLRQSFAPAELRILDYARARAAPGGLVARLLAEIAPDLPAGDLPARPQGWSNVSPQVLPVWAAQVVAGSGLPPPHLLRATREAFDLEYGDRKRQSLFTRAECQEIAAHFAPGNARLAGQLGHPFHLSDPDQPDDTLFREDIGPDLWIRVARRLSLAMEREPA